MEGTMRPRIQGRQRRLRCRDDGPEDLSTMMETSAEDNASKDSKDGNGGVREGRGNDDTPKGTSPTAEAAVV